MSEPLKRYNENEYFVCPKPCRNITYSSLPRTSEPMTEQATCAYCGRVIEFSTIASPKKVSYPVSRRKWGARTHTTSSLLKYTTENWENPETRQKDRIASFLRKFAK